MPDFVRTYDSSSVEYRQAFDVFLAHTDEKAKIKEHLEGIITLLTTCQNLSEVGAGNGTLPESRVEQMQSGWAGVPIQWDRSDDKGMNEMQRFCRSKEALSNGWTAARQGHSP